MRKNTYFSLVLIIITLVISGCSGGPDASVAIEEYLTGVFTNDPILAINASCAEWEENASAEGLSMEGVDLEYESIECEVLEGSDAEATVSCSSIITFSYNGGESLALDLSDRLYIANFTNGEWKMCGYK
jgi:hypothetical protein